jgi:hypothetical protein
MKLLGIIAAVALALYLGVTLAFPSYTHRYRLTIEIDTPEGARSGSSVIEVTRKDVRWVLIAQGRYTFREHGDAVFVDLGAGRNVIALLATGPNGQNVDQMITLPIEAYGYYKWDEDAWAGRVKMQGPVELQAPLIPTLITMPDVSDPKSAQVIYAFDFQEVRESSGALRRVPRLAIDRFSEKFGPGFRFKRATLETTRDDVTRGIENKIPWITQMKAQGLGSRIDGDPRSFRLNVPYLTVG